MHELNPAELDLLARIDAKEGLRPYFFRKARGLKWFNALEERGYFDPAGNRAPVPAKEEGYVSVPFWPVTDYLVATSPELLSEENRAYAERVLDIIRKVTQVAMDKEFGNYRTWFQFSNIIQNIPIDLIRFDDLIYIDYWLDDKYDRTLVAGILGEKWLVTLLDKATGEAKTIALGLLKLLYRTSFVTEPFGDSDRQLATFRFDKWHAEKITKAVAGRSGQVLGQQAVHIFAAELQHVLDVLGNDGWSSLWRAAIEDHDQNSSAEDVEDILIIGFRDALNSFVRETPEPVAYVEGLLKDQFQTLRRVAVYTIDKNFQLLCVLIDKVIHEDYFYTNVRHEVWHLLRNHYLLFPEPVQRRVQDIISRIAEEDSEGNRRIKETAYTQAIWLSAIKDHAEGLNEWYGECVDAAGVQPDHPDFPSYSSSGWVVHESPKPSEELLAMGIDRLIAYLDEYEDPRHFGEPGLEGLVKALKAAAKASPLKFSLDLEKFSSLDTSYVHALIEAFSELWAERKELPWDDVWESLLNFCGAVIQREEFWSAESSEKRAHFVANRYWVVGSIGQLIESGTKSDDHAFSTCYMDQAKELVVTLLHKESGEEFKPDCDAVFIAINSPRGRCLEALINLALRSCRLADRESGGHSESWADLQPIFEEELAKPDTGEYEFITLLVNYLPNFIYMSRKWVYGNLARIFDRANYQKWLCSIQAYAYVTHVYEEIYNHLKKNDHFSHALDDKNLKDTVSKRIVQNIVIAYLNDYESLQDEYSLISQLFDRSRNNELRELIWFIWTLRNNDDKDFNKKVLDLWRGLLQTIDTDTKKGQQLLSKLTTWSVFITEVNDTNRDLIIRGASFAGEDYNSYDLLESIARISVTQPEEAVEIWDAVLQNSAPDYPEEAIRKTLSNLVASGNAGQRRAYSIVDEYLKRGNEKPAAWLQEILEK